MDYEVIFVKVRNDKGKLYDSYTDYWSLVELSEFPTCELDDVDPESNNIYVFSPDNGNVKACCERPHKAKYILWQLERPTHTGLNMPTYFDEMWVSDLHLFQMVNNPKCKYVVIGGHPGLGEFSFYEPKTYDFAHMSYAYGRREAMYDELRRMGYSLAPNGWGEERHKVLKSSRAMLCFHQDDMPVIEPLRYVLAACYGLPIIAEASENHYPYAVQIYNGNHPNRDEWEQIAQENRQRMTEELTFRKCIEDVL